jgi:ribose/xylose/arabinose/galactoside ABC-type transport system permease subunit
VPKYGNLLLLGTLIGSVALFYAGVLHFSNVMNVFSQYAIVGVCAVGMTFVILTGGIDLSVGSVVALSGAFGAWLNTVPSLPWPLAWTLTLVLGMICGFISGALVHWGRVPAFMATLAMMSIARGATLILTRGYPISGTTPGFNFPGWAYIGPLPVAGLIMVGLLLLAWLVLRHTPFGTYVYALGDSPESLRLAGVGIARSRISVYVISGGTAALGGLLMVGRLWSAQPNIGLGMELDVIASVVLGGTSLFGGLGGVKGTFVGIMIMGFLDNGLRLIEVSSYLQQIIKGTVFVGAILLDMYLKGEYRKNSSRDR